MGQPDHVLLAPCCPPVTPNGQRVDGPRSARADYSSWVLHHYVTKVGQLAGWLAGWLGGCPAAAAALLRLLLWHADGRSLCTAGTGVQPCSRRRSRTLSS